MSETKRPDSNVNYFVLASVPLYFGASIDSYLRGHEGMAGVWFCYAMANALLCYVEVKA